MSHMFKKKTNLIQLIDGLVRLIVFENSPFQGCLRVKARLALSQKTQETW